MKPLTSIPIIPGEHTVNGGTHVRTLPFTLDIGDSILSMALSIVLQPDVTAPQQVLVLDEVSTGQISGQVWGVNFLPVFGAPGTAVLLVSLTLASQPDEPQEDQLYRLIIV